jgi:hypothetical protein
MSLALGLPTEGLPTEGIDELKYERLRELDSSDFNSACRPSMGFTGASLESLESSSLLSSLLLSSYSLSPTPTLLLSIRN